MGGMAQVRGARGGAVLKRLALSVLSRYYREFDVQQTKKR